MKIYMSVDMEGATGVVKAEQTRAGDPEYAFGRKMQTHDLIAAIEGAFDGGADEILINDAHSSMINISPADLPGKDGSVRIISGTPKALGMMEGVEGCDGAFFLCYHAMAGTEKAVLDHTISGGAVYGVKLNGKNVGEIGLNAAVCGGLNIPVALFTGDEVSCKEARLELGESLYTSSVKKATGHSAAVCLPPEITREDIRKKASLAAGAIKSGNAPVFPVGDGTFELDITFHYTSQADEAGAVPATKRVDGRTIRVNGNDMSQMRRWAGALISLGGTVSF